MVRRITGVAAACGLILAWLLVVLRPRRMAVVGTSMLPALRPGDHLLVIRAGRPRPGGLAVVRAPSGVEVVKRVAVIAERGIWVAGDNPEASTDSRAWGFLPRSAVRGRPVYRYAPAERAGRLPGRSRHGARPVGVSAAQAARR